MVYATMKTKSKIAFNAQAFLDSAGVARKVVEYGKSEKMYAQGDLATSVMYIQNGSVKLSVVNEVGKTRVPKPCPAARTSTGPRPSEETCTGDGIG